MGVPTPEAGVTRLEGVSPGLIFVTGFTSLARSQVGHFVLAVVTFITAATRVNISERVDLVNTLPPRKREFYSEPFRYPRFAVYLQSEVV